MNSLSRLHANHRCVFFAAIFVFLISSHSRAALIQVTELFNDGNVNVASRGWTGLNNGSNGDSYGLSATTNAAGAGGGNVAEAGGTFTRQTTANPISYYADTSLGGSLTLNDPISFSGLIRFTSITNDDQSTSIGYFDTGNLASANNSRLAITFNEVTANTSEMRINLQISLPNGTVRTTNDQPFTANAASLKYVVTYSPTANGNLGQAILDLRNAITDVSLANFPRPALNLLAGDKANGGNFNAFGLFEPAVVGAASNKTVAWFTDNANYTTIIPEPTTALSALIGTMSLMWTRRSLRRVA